MPATETCTRCSESKDLGEFYAHGRAKDGLQSWCRSCFAAFRRERAQSGRIKAIYSESKVCADCLVEKPSSDFSKNWAHGTGLQQEVEQLAHKMHSYRPSSFSRCSGDCRRSLAGGGVLLTK